MKNIGRGRGDRVKSRHYDYNSLIEAFLLDGKEGYYKEAKKQNMGYGYARTFRNRLKKIFVGFVAVSSQQNAVANDFLTAN